MNVDHQCRNYRICEGHFEAKIHKHSDVGTLLVYMWLI